MKPTRMRYLVLAIAILLLSRPPVRGDYFWTDTEHGSVSVWTYPETSLQPGQARIHFNGYWPGSGNNGALFLDSVAFNTDLTLSPNQISAPKGWKVTSNGSVPGFGRFSWLLQTSQPHLSDIFVDVTISGLGNNVSASHFWLPSTAAGITSPVTPATFAFHDGAIEYSQGRDDQMALLPPLVVPQGPDSGWFSGDTNAIRSAPVTPSPEPSALVLLGVGMAGLLGWKCLQRRRMQGMRLVRS